MSSYICPMQTRKAVTVWLICGLILVYFQIIIGGITRLTGSGLSITKWEIVTGSLPPLSEKAWEEEFGKYKATPQYEKINQGMDIGPIWKVGTFKFIYFWEYFHRLWARSMGLIFLFPFLFFLWKKWLPKSLIKDLGVVIALAALAACFGWIMVASGLINRPWVNAYKLSIHLCIGISVFAYLLWTFIKYRHGDNYQLNLSTPISTGLIWWLFGLLIFQLFLGGIMSGMKAALVYPTWPNIGETMIPSEILDSANWTWTNFRHYDKGSFVFSLIHFLHRNVAYILTVLMLYYTYKNKPWKLRSKLDSSFLWFGGLVLLQIVLGIITLVQSIGFVPVVWGVLHQGVAVLVFGAFLWHLYYVLSILKE